MLYGRHKFQISFKIFALPASVICLILVLILLDDVHFNYNNYCTLALTWLCYSWPSFAVDILGMRITTWWTMLWHGFAIHDPLLLLTSLAWKLLYDEQCNQLNSNTIYKIWNTSSTWCFFNLFSFMLSHIRLAKRRRWIFDSSITLS